MRIRTRVKIGGALIICVLLAYGAVVLHLDRTMSNLAQEVKEANKFVNKITTLRTLTQEFLLYRTERSQRQWSTVYAELIQLLHNPTYRVLMSEYGIGDHLNKLKIVGDTFSRLITIGPSPGPGNPEREARGELQSRLTTQLLLASQDLLTRFLNLSAEINQKLIKTQRLTSILDILALAALGILLVSNVVFLQRSVVIPVLKLHEGAEIIGAGYLDHKMGIASRDEVGQLSQAFDRMTANLKEITVSRDELAKEVEERQQAEEALRESREDLNRAQAVAHIGSWRLNVRKNELTWSDENHRIFGIPLGTPMSYETFLGTVHPEDREYVDREWKAALRGEPYDIEHRILVGDEVKWVSEKAELEFDSEGQLLGGFGTTQDITERKQSEEKLKRTLVDLERSNQALEEFAYVASHDLQEPLRKMANFSEMLANRYQGQLDERADTYLDYIADGARRMKDLINDLLAFSRVGRSDFPLISADIHDILRTTLNDIQPLVQEKQAEITHEPLPTLKVNPHQMGQLLQNLIANAIKFHGDQPPRIHVSASLKGREWVMAVHDNGIGFEPQYAEGIFKVFRRLHTKEEYPGTGIGLAICKKIVERHGGRIWAESELGRGATFYFTIPA